ncbi:acetyl-CoA carboxylase, biotin carboxylase subunit [Robiginitalea myxolifaciens]|uniref:Acetyl-CoA carboxylase, biotin carboxylase subunit n=1 Tax=Robiginitalea myxolifaciens TaxID=400055 RepID=A0A1I6FN76_9FLAO|nr:acetyl-CoA carboxylase biotin carboxylase subunit [Robiginitalea myxolifaciens]SFR31399.1 acetyl-CoA carboxylase, biotin carboxylase subunit [Robiginitalea myxolifaciens]
MKKVLIANRGEIALRVMRTARKMGLATVAVYSEADRDAPHVRFADEAVCLGGPASSDSYLRGDRIVAAAQRLGVDAIHPGYGFLSENAGFAQQVTAAGLVFIGPGPKAIEVMGDKLAAKEAVKAYGIPMVPGTEEPINDPEEVREIAAQIGYPILIKAAAGGGGKGMRVVEKPAELKEQIARAMSEAESAFGDGSVFIEKYVAKPRHIEIQIMADTHGNIVHLFERECSVQRRHQKVVEEAPSAVLDAELRNAMGTAAVDVARACDYVGAGTVEFLLDADHNFYFLEMNTRLQVEHPVTELITGQDLVEWQIRVARGEKLPLSQEELRIQGHALELRVYAEDPLDNFLPSVGQLATYTLPEGEGIRVDNGYEQGMQVPIYYDPMLSKLITYGPDRNAAIRRMIDAIAAYRVEGVATTLEFGDFVCRHPAFVSGDFSTHFVKLHYQPEKIRDQKKREAEIAARIALRHYLKEKGKLRINHA